MRCKPSEHNSLKKLDKNERPETGRKLESFSGIKEAVFSNRVIEASFIE
jgi:hypothetical protein